MHRAIVTKEMLQRLLGFQILNWPGSYICALTHKSAAGVVPWAAVESYEKLEFLGDSVLNFIVGRYLFETYGHSPTINEGFLTQMRTKLVSGKALATIAHRMGLQNVIIMSDKALTSGFNTNPRILEDVLESLIGACYLDLGLVGAREFVLSLIHTYVDESMLVNNNFKDALMQHCQAQGKDTPLPEYQSTKVGDIFQVTAVACGATGRGSAKVKKEAQQLAAEDCLRVLGVLKKNKTQA